MKNIYKFLFVVVLFVFLYSCKSSNTHNCPSVYDNETKMQVYKVVDEFPSFPGGRTPMMRYIAKNYRPVEEWMQGIFYLGFVVTKTGKVEGVRVLKKREDEYTENEKMMIKVFESMPRWNPGKCHGEKVSVLCLEGINIHPR